MLYVTRDPSGKRKAVTYQHPQIYALNARYRAGELDAAQAKVELEKLRADEYARLAADRRRLLHADNIEIAERFVKNVIKSKVDILAESRDSEASAVWRFMERMGKRSMGTATHNEIQRALNQITKEGAYRHEFKTARAILRFVNRHAEADKLRPKKFEHKEPPYLTREQLQQVIDNIPPSVLDTYPVMPELMLIVYNLGLRISEALALDKPDVIKRQGVVRVRVSRQFVQRHRNLAEEDRIRPPKNKRIREVVPLNREETLKALAKWIQTHPTPQSREPYRTKISEVIRTLAKKLFQVEQDAAESADEFFFDEDTIPEADDIREYKAVHMLRAGHAVHIIETTGNEVFAANQIGDSPEVLRKHYAGRLNKDKAMQIMVSLLEAKR